MGAPLNPVPNVLKVFLEGFVDNDEVYKWGNILHFGYTGTAPSNATCAAIATGIVGFWATRMAPECPSPTTLQKCVVTDLTSDSAGQGEHLAVVPGTRGDDSIPANAAVLITYPAAIRYRGGHPRTYLYVLGNADLEGAAHWSAAGVAEVQAHWQGFLGDCLSISSSGCVLSSFGFVRYHGKFLPNGGPPHYYLNTPLFEAITVSQALASAEMASQRRRVGRRKA